MKANNCIWGIDYGSKLAGTTVIGHLESHRVQFFASIKNKRYFLSKFIKSFGE